MGERRQRLGRLLPACRTGGLELQDRLGGDTVVGADLDVTKVDSARLKYYDSA